MAEKNYPETRESTPIKYGLVIETPGPVIEKPKPPAFTWEPNKRPDIEGRLNLDIYEPPCRHCKYFKPRITTDVRGEFDGVIICHKEDGEMEHDFSCFRSKEV